MNEIERKCIYYYDMHKLLHGKNFSIEDVKNEIKYNIGSNKYYENRSFIREILYKKYYNNEKYGIFIGRFQPFHNGHNQTIQEIIRDGKIPVIFIGSINKNDENNPLSFIEREEIINIIYKKECIIIPLEDCDNWNTWFKSINGSLYKNRIKKNDCTLYFHNKDIDKQNFNFRGEYYENESYTIMFQEDGFNVKPVCEKMCDFGWTIHASEIRKDETIAQRNLDSRVYKYLKNKGWWSEEIS
jgi:nicotinamide mononucleotide adenylyltransferase